MGQVAWTLFLPGGQESGVEIDMEHYCQIPKHVQKQREHARSITESEDHTARPPQSPQREPKREKPQCPEMGVATAEHADSVSGRSL